MVATDEGANLNWCLVPYMRDPRRTKSRIKFMCMCIYICITLPSESTNESTNNGTLHSSNAKESSSFLPTKRSFKLASLNITSLPKHIDELRVFLADKPVDALSINETRLHNSVEDSDVYIPG